MRELVLNHHKILRLRDAAMISTQHDQYDSSVSLTDFLRCLLSLFNLRSL
jgi:hypothetical protein